MTYILPSLILSFFLHIPKFFELKHNVMEVQQKNNVSLELFSVTSLRLNPYYILYYKNVIIFLTTGVVPFLYLSCMNILIFTRIRQNNKNRNKSKSTKKAENLATILIFIGIFMSSVTFLSMFMQLV